MTDELITLKKTLNGIFIVGQENIYYMLGAMQLVDKLIEDSKKNEEAKDNG